MSEFYDSEFINDFREFDPPSSGAALTYPVQGSALRKNGYVVIKNRPCKIVDISTSKTGKHGHAKIHLIANDIFTHKKFEDLSPSTHNMDVPNISCTEYTVLDTDEDFLNLLTDNGDLKDDLKIVDHALLKYIKDELIERTVKVKVIKALGEEAVIKVTTIQESEN